MHWCYIMRIKPVCAHENIWIYYIIIVVNLPHVSVAFYGHLQGGGFTNDILQRQPSQRTYIKLFYILYWYTGLIVLFCICTLAVLSLQYILRKASPLRWPQKTTETCRSFTTIIKYQIHIYSCALVGFTLILTRYSKNRMWAWTGLIWLRAGTRGWLLWTSGFIYEGNVSTIRGTISYSRRALLG